jgi:chromosome segregation ATPase
MPKGRKMGRSKSPVDELVDGIDAIGSILDENLPQIKSRIAELDDHQRDNNSNINDIRRSVKEMDEVSSDLRKALTNLDIRIEEILGTIGALGRRMDQVQKSMLDLTLQFEAGGGDSELADTVKVLEDRLKRLEKDKTVNDDIPRQY